VFINEQQLGVIIENLATSAEKILNATTATGFICWTSNMVGVELIRFALDVWVAIFVFGMDPAGLPFLPLWRSGERRKKRGIARSPVTAVQTAHCNGPHACFVSACKKKLKVSIAPNIALFPTLENSQPRRMHLFICVPLMESNGVQPEDRSGVSVEILHGYGLHDQTSWSQSPITSCKPLETDAHEGVPNKLKYNSLPLF
jgi:hypothetical protein